ncbi:MAG: AAA family ATPase [Verrucomicrobia bacterium]|nr:AAA family ATPase [Verrucomicrobiota bacterium]
MITPVEFKPKTIEDFCGPARQVAGLLQKMIHQRAPQGIPMRVLLKGDAGVGKSSLAQWFVNQIAPDPFAVKFFNGTEVTMERVSELIADLSYRPMGGGYRCVWIDEADGIPTTAHKRFLSYMDRLKNTKHSAIVTNRWNNLKNDFRPVSNRSRSKGRRLKNSKFFSNDSPVTPGRSIKSPVAPAVLPAVPLRPCNSKPPALTCARRSTIWIPRCW